MPGLGHPRARAFPDTIRGPALKVQEERVNFPSRRSLWALLSVLCFHAAPAAAQDFPVKPVRVIVPFAPGGATDVVFRLLAPKLSENLGQQALIENRAGGVSTIRMDVVAKASPDRSTLGVANHSLRVKPSLLAQLPYD